MKKTLITVFFLIYTFLQYPLFAQLNFERDFAIGPGNSGFSSWVEIGGKMYFSANDSYFGNELWQFDPATEQAHRLTDLNGLSGSSLPKHIVEYNGSVYFIAWLGNEGQQIFKFEPDTWEVERVTITQDESFRPFYLSVYNGKLWFSALDANGYNLWNYEASTGAFTMIPPPADGHPTNFRPYRKFVYNNKLYLNANNPDNVLELWSYDDLTSEFDKVPTQFDGQQSLSIDDFTPCNGELMLNISGDWYHYNESLDSCIFLAQNNSQTYRGGSCVVEKFWYPDYSENDVKAYDPSTGAIEYLKDLSSSAPFQPYSIKSIGGELYIWDIAGSMNTLYKYNPATNEIESLFESDVIFTQMNTLMVNDGDYYYFGKNIDTEVYKYDTATESPELIADINQSNGGGFSNSPRYRFQTYNGRMYFNAYPYVDNVFWPEADLWSKSPTAGDYIILEDQLTSGEGPFIQNKMVEINGRIYFSGSVKDGEVRQLVSYQSGEDSLRWHGNVISPPTGFNLLLINLGQYNDYLIFSAFRDYYYQTQFFRFDTNTEELELLPGLEDYVGEPRLIIDDHLLFTGSDTNDIWGRHFLSFDLLTGEVTEIANDSIFVGSGEQVYRSGDKAFCTVREPGSNNYAIQLFNPATGEKSTIIPAGFSSIEPNAPIFHEGKTWFHDDVQDSSRVFTLDPVTEVCEEAVNLGTETPAQGEMIWFDGKLFFYGGQSNSEFGRELYFYDPATGTIELYADINFGPVSSSARSFFIFADRLYLVADDGHRGEELWSIGKCFSVSLEAIPDPMGNNEGAINLTVESGAEPYAFSWNTGATTQNIDGLSTGYYEVTITDAAGCEATAFALLEGGIIVGTSDVVFPTQFNIYPNPANEYLNIELSEIKGNTSAYIFNYTGIKMWESKNISEREVIDVSQFANGIYFVVLRGEKNEWITSKVMVQH